MVRIFFIPKKKNTLKKHRSDLGNTMSRSRKFCYTNFGEDQPGLGPMMVYHCRQEEICPTTGKRHFQGFIYFKHAKSLKEVINAKVPGFHWEIALGTPEQNRAYCSKTNVALIAPIGPDPAQPNTMSLIPPPRGGDVAPLQPFEEWGIMPSQGKRNDLHEIEEMIRNGSSYADLCGAHFGTCVRYGRGIQQAMGYLNKPKPEVKEVHIIVGPTGAGKSRPIWEKFPDLYSKPNGKWWDFYDGEETVLFDDWDGDIPREEMLKICDRYPLRVPVKGAFIWLRAKRIYITSNHDLYIYNDEAFKRRITSYRHIGNEPNNSGSAYLSPLTLSIERTPDRDPCS